MNNNMGVFFFKVIIPFMILNYYCFCTAQHGVSLITDQHALEAIKAQIIVDPSGTLSKNWSTKTSVCNWEGVTCGFQSRTWRVIGLNLSYMGLVGTISPHIGNLSFLSLLDFTNNSFHGSIPPEIAQLSHMEKVGMTRNSLTGDLPLAYFKNMSKLEKLYLNRNNFTGTLPPYFLDNMTSLKTLILSYNSLHGSIPKELGNRSCLEYFYVSYNQLTGFVPLSFFNQSCLREIELSYNSLSGSLPDDMCDDRLKFLTGLYISKNEFTGPIPSSIFKCQQLIYISISYNKFNGIIPRAIGNSTLLEKLYLGHNDLQGSIPPEVGNLTKLIHLYLDNSKLSGVIPDEINHLYHLEELSLLNNSISGNVRLNISALKVLDLSSNLFSSVLPADMGFMLPNLQKLYLKYNAFRETLPSSLSNASKLLVIEVAENSFSGSIPITFGRLELLERLNLGGNNFTVEGSELSFLSSLTNCRKLHLLSFYENPLKASLPASIGNLSTSLTTFVAADCGIKGIIPNEIGNLTNLQWLSLKNNEFKGNIPITLGKLQNIRMLSLRFNKLHGGIPKELCILKNLERLYLSNNQLSGTIPKCLGDISLLELELSSNRLTSTIPSTLWSHKSLISLSLSSNFLTGNLHTSIATSDSPLNGLDLSFNRLSGDIPSTISGYQMLSILFLANNNLQGSIPESFGKLISLESLDLSQNNLSGEIPKSLETLKHLEFLNLSFNSLHGEIPSRGSFSNFTASSFMHNKDLCGEPRLEVLSCRNKVDGSRKFSSLKYILPIISLIITIAFAAYILKKYKTHTRTNIEQPSLHELKRLSYYELLKATESYDESNLIGNGAYGSVFKGKLSDGVFVAVKVFNLLSEGAAKSFEVECEVLRNIRHRNLVRVINSCTNMDFRCLVMEYMSSGSLEQWLYSHNNHLSLVQRLQILIDVASGLEYLHHGLPTPIIHCDIKPNNVLLDEDMHARVCDFGIAQIFGEEEFRLRTTTLGTIGYMAPEYGMGGIVSPGSDVYSFGVLLLESFTRKKPTDEMFSGELTLRNWVLEAIERSVFEVIDKDLVNKHLNSNQESLASIFHLAMDCTSNSASQRINMKETVVRLCKIQKNFLANN